MSELSPRPNSDVTLRVILRTFVPQLVTHARERMTVAYGHAAVEQLEEVVRDSLQRSAANAARRDAMLLVGDRANDLFDHLDLAACRVLYEAKFDVLVRPRSAGGPDYKRERREWIESLQRVLEMRNRLAHDSTSPDLSHDEAEGVLNPLTRLLESLGATHAALRAREGRAELGGSPRSVRAGVGPGTRSRRSVILGKVPIGAAVLSVAAAVALVVIAVERRENEGTDASRPLLPLTDEGLVDKRGGWEWSDRCYVHLKAGRWGWAKAECDEGMKMGSRASETRGPLLYNEGMIARASGDIAGARRYFKESLAVRENSEVRAALTALPAE